jgi:hypothetical protein
MTDTVRGQGLQGEFVERWQCEMPSAGSAYRVTNETWLDPETPDGLDVRVIHSIELVEIL